jgi:hypothetical protein
MIDAWEYGKAYLGCYAPFINKDFELITIPAGLVRIKTDYTTFSIHDCLKKLIAEMEGRLT